MMASRTLMERLERPDVAGGARDRRDVEETLASVQRHLSILLNSRKGFAPAAPDYGISDFADVRAAGQSADEIVEEVRGLIDRFEPRLREVRVRSLPERASDFILHFEITAKVIVGEDLVAAKFTSSIARSGAHVVEGRLR